MAPRLAITVTGAWTTRSDVDEQARHRGLELSISRAGTSRIMECKAGGMFERFTDRARRVLVLAQEEARLLNHSFIGTEHLLLGLIQEGEGVAARALSELDISLAAVRRKVEDMIGLSGGQPLGSPPFTPRSKKVLELALREALQLGHTYIGTEHILLGIVREREGVAAQVLESLGADLPRVRQTVIQILSEYQGGDPVTLGANPLSIGGSISFAGVVTCSFCGKGSPESGQLISGANAYICEHCIREWSGRLADIKPPRPVRSSVVVRNAELPVAGQAPEDIESARTAIRAAFADSNTESEDGASVPSVEKGETFGPILVAAKQRRRNLVPPDTEVVTLVDEIVFTNPDHAAVLFSIAADGRTILPRHRGDAVLVDGAWKVARSTFCDLMAMAGVPCPPDIR